MENIDKKIRLMQLYDIYGMMLTNKQRQSLELYLEEDYNLVEIAELESVSKQAIFDKINISMNKLELYEKNLKILKNRELFLSKLEDIKNLIGKIDVVDEKINEIMQCLNEFEQIVVE